MTDLDLDFSRDMPENELTNIAAKTIQKLSRNYVHFNSNGMAKLLKINKRTLHNWEKANLIFPTVWGLGKKHVFRRYFTPDVLRAITIKYLMSELGYKKFTGVRLLLEMVNKALPEERQKDTINNIWIDRYLMAVLNYDFDKIAESKLQANSRKVEYDY